MKQSCPKCHCTIFQFADIDIENSAFSFVAIQCKSCGFPIGITNVENVPATVIKKANETIDEVKKLNPLHS